MYSLTLLIFLLDPCVGFPLLVVFVTCSVSPSPSSHVSSSLIQLGVEGLKDSLRVLGLLILRFRDHVYSREFVAGKTYHPRLFLLITYLV
jgi:hypothetical protein